MIVFFKKLDGLIIGTASNKNLDAQTVTQLRTMLPNKYPDNHADMDVDKVKPDETAAAGGTWDAATHTQSAAPVPPTPTPNPEKTEILRIRRKYASDPSSVTLREIVDVVMKSDVGKVIAGE